MNCADVQQVLPEIMEGSHDGEFQAHLKGCPACAELVSDLELIANEARQLAASDDPAPRVWVKIAAQLRAEGIIREPEAAPVRPVLVHGVGRRWNPWWLVPVAAALVAAGSYVLNRQPVQQVATETTTAAPAQQTAVQQTPPEAEGTTKPAQQAKVAETSRTHGRTPIDRVVGTTVSTAEDQQFLNQLGQRSPGMRATYESQLQSVNAYITDAEAYLRQNPGDEYIRQQLMDAYEQKAMLYQMALDHVQ